MARTAFFVGGAIVGLYAVFLIAETFVQLVNTDAPVHDALIYMLAGERVNTGGQVYDLRLSDYLPPIPEDDRSAPVYTPPLFVPLFRVLAVFGGWGALVWILAVAFAGIAALFYALLLTRGWVGIDMIPLGVAMGYTIYNGNIDLIVLGGVFVAWWLRDRQRPLGALVGTLALLKLTPAVLFVWLLATRRWQAVRWAVCVGVALAVATALLTEPGIWLRYAGVVVRGTSTGVAVNLLIAAIGLLAVVAIGRRWPRTAFILAIALIPLGNPQGGAHSGLLFVGCCAPLMDWPGARFLRSGLRE